MSFWRKPTVFRSHSQCCLTFSSDAPHRTLGVLSSSVRWPTMISQATQWPGVTGLQSLSIGVLYLPPSALSSSATSLWWVETDWDSGDRYSRPVFFMWSWACHFSGLSSWYIRRCFRNTLQVMKTVPATCVLQPSVLCPWPVALHWHLHGLMFKETVSRPTSTNRAWAPVSPTHTVSHEDSTSERQLNSQSRFTQHQEGGLAFRMESLTSLKAETVLPTATVKSVRHSFQQVPYCKVSW